MAASHSENGPLIRRAIDRYHELLQTDLGPRSGAALTRRLQEMRLMFGERPICRVLRPYFLTRREADVLRRETETLMSAFRKVLAVVRHDPAFRDVLRLSAAEEAVIGADRQGIEPDQIARLDGFLVRDGPFRVIEYNAESPGGIAFGDMMVEAFRDMPVYEAFTKEFRLSTYGGLANTLAQLLAAWCHRVGQGASNPHIGVVDFKSAPTFREFEICAEYFTAQGCPSRVIEPGELRFEDGRLRAGDFPLDVVYKRALVKDFVKAGGLDHALVRAVQAGAVTCASGFEVHVLYRKELFAFLWDDAVLSSLEAAERDAVRRCVPWSRIVQDVETIRDGRSVRLVDVILEGRERLVLKPTDEYGGKGVVLGWLVTPQAWQDALAVALREPYLVQERVTLGNEVFPVWQDGQIDFQRFYVDIDPYVWGGRSSRGFGARLAAGELLNVTAGGGSAVPVCVIEN